MIRFLELLRIKHWVKNGFVLMPLVFGGMLGNYRDVMRAMEVFGIFCLLSSGIYVMNDISDLKADKVHPIKKHRPLAEGEIGIKTALFILTSLLGISLFLGYMMGAKVFVVVLLYLMLNVLYDLVLKKIIILDVISVALGFELRVWGGAVALNIVPTVWLQLCVFLLALFLGFIKRRHEKIVLCDKAIEHREVLMHYTPYFLDQVISISATLVTLFYALYVVSPDVVTNSAHRRMAYTIPFVIYGIFRYLYLVYAKELGGDPSDILTSDLPFALNLLLWVFSAGVILYIL